MQNINTDWQHSKLDSLCLIKYNYIDLHRIDSINYIIYIQLAIYTLYNNSGWTYLWTVELIGGKGGGIDGLAIKLYMYCMCFK